MVIERRAPQWAHKGRFISSNYAVACKSWRKIKNPLDEVEGIFVFLDYGTEA